MISDVASRYGAEVVKIDEEWGNIIPIDKITDTLGEHPDAKMFAIVHAGRRLLEESNPLRTSDGCLEIKKCYFLWMRSPLCLDVN